MNGCRIQRISAAFDMRDRDGELVTTQSKSPFFLRQGDVDAGCGIYCALMGLVVGGAISHRQARHVASSNRRVPSAFWRAAAADFFLGTNSKEIISCVGLATDRLKVQKFSLKPRSIKRNLLVALDSGEFVMGRIGIKADTFDHWVVITGVEGIEPKRRFSPTGLLLLDPQEEAPRYRFYNALIRFGTQRKPHHYLSDGYRKEVALVEMLIFRQRGPI